jgi:hypothetical protein
MNTQCVHGQSRLSTELARVRSRSSSHLYTVRAQVRFEGSRTTPFGPLSTKIAAAIAHSGPSLRSSFEQFQAMGLFALSPLAAESRLVAQFYVPWPTARIGFGLTARDVGLRSSRS